MAHLEITTGASPGQYDVWVNQIDISDLLRSVEIKLEADKLPKVVMEFVLDSVDLDIALRESAAITKFYSSSDADEEPEPYRYIDLDKVDQSVERKLRNIMDES